MTEGISEAEHDVENLERVMSQCTSTQRFVVEQVQGGQLIGYRRGERIYGFSVREGSAPTAKAVHRLEVGQLVDMIGSDNIFYATETGTTPVTFLEAIPFTPQGSYAIPPTATHVRRKKKQLLFYQLTTDVAEEITEKMDKCPPSQRQRKRKYAAIPEDAGRVTIHLGGYGFTPGPR